jgi:non-canonical (house-cleaning) NTP pyrophosphatase
MNEKSQSPSKRGRKPIGDAPMTAAERKRASRARKAADGRVEFMLGLGGGMLAFVDRMVLASGSSRSQALFDLIEMAISRMALMEVLAEEMWENGATGEEVQAFMSESLRSAPPPHLVQRYKEKMGIQ